MRSLKTQKLVLLLVVLAFALLAAACSSVTADVPPQADRNLGIVNIEVGFAPLKPAEFVVIKIQQIAGEL